MNGRSLPFALAFVGLTCVIAGNTTACAKEPIIVHDLSPAASCIVNELAEMQISGDTDPMQIVATCAGVTIADIVKLIADLLDNQPGDGGALAASPPTTAHQKFLVEVFARAKAAHAK